MGSTVSEIEEPASGSSSATGFHYRAQEGLFDEIKPDWNTFVRRLLNKYGAWTEVAVRIYPLDEMSDIPLEQQKKQAVDNLRRTLNEHLPEDREERERLLRADRRPRHFAMLWLDIIVEVIPDAGIAIAHFAADKYGTERGAVKVDAVRLKDEFEEISGVCRQVSSAVDKLTKRVDKLGSTLERIQKEGR